MGGCSKTLSLESESIFFFFLLCTKPPNIISVQGLKNIFIINFFTKEKKYTQAGMDEA